MAKVALLKIAESHGENVDFVPLIKAADTPEAFEVVHLMMLGHTSHLKTERKF
jgi:hypothetical protein